jgi:hypothetical protein
MTTETAVRIVISNRSLVVRCLRESLTQRPGLEFNNYGDEGAYRQEGRRITQQLNDGLAMLRAVELMTTAIDYEAIVAAFPQAWYGRLTWDGKALDYTTGQYWCVEYRAAVCAVLARVLANHWRGETGAGRYAFEAARVQLGAGIAKRWFK